MKHSIAAVLTCAALSATASAGVTGGIQFAFEVDSFYVLDQAAATLTTSEGATVFELPLFMAPDFFPEFVHSNGGSGYWITLSMDLDPGTYTLTLFDGFGDGWQDVAYGGDTVGGVLVTNDLADDPFIASKNFFNGASTSVSFTIVPAPGAIALIGLSALCGGRRRRTA